jgi:translation elongation factor EF-4
VCHRTKSQYQGRRVCEKLRGAIDRQQFEVVIQAAIGNKVSHRFSTSLRRPL